MQVKQHQLVKTIKKDGHHPFYGAAFNLTIIKFINAAEHLHSHKPRRIAASCQPKQLLCS